jgi:hypothetical protein
MSEVLASLGYALAFVGLPIVIIVVATVWTARGDD